jgi:hypothetical protein
MVKLVLALLASPTIEATVVVRLLFVTSSVFRRKLIMCFRSKQRWRSSSVYQRYFQGIEWAGKRRTAGP